MFLARESLADWRYVAVTERRTTQDFAHQMRWLVHEAYPDVPVIRLASDNLNTHRMASLYETFPPGESQRIANRLEFHYTSKHSSWLNMVKIEFNILSRSCLRQRLPEEESPCRQIQALELERNQAQAASTGDLASKTPAPNSIDGIPSKANSTQHCFRVDAPSKQAQILQKGVGGKESGIELHLDTLTRNTTITIIAGK